MLKTSFLWHLKDIDWQILEMLSFLSKLAKYLYLFFFKKALGPGTFLIALVYIFLRSVGVFGCYIGFHWDQIKCTPSPRGSALNSVPQHSSGIHFPFRSLSSYIFSQFGTFVFYLALFSLDFGLFTAFRLF